MTFNQDTFKDEMFIILNGLYTVVEKARKEK